MRELPVKRRMEVARALVAKNNPVIVELRQQSEARGRKQGIDEGRKQGIDEGRKQGIDEGRKQGIDEGKLRERRETLLELLVEKFGPVRSVTPTMVFELGFEGIQKSPRHKSGIAVRFPRILRWRQDKPVEEADTLANVRALLEVQA